MADRHGTTKVGRGSLRTQLIGNRKGERVEISNSVRILSVGKKGHAPFSHTTAHRLGESKRREGMEYAFNLNSRPFEQRSLGG